MRAIVWGVFALLAAGWTGLVAISVQITEWLLGMAASGQVGDVATAAGQWPVPAWLALWVDPQAIEALQLAWADAVQWLGAVLPSAGGLAGWVSAAVWIVWGFGLAGLLALAGVLHWLVGKARGPAHLQRA